MRMMKDLATKIIGYAIINIAMFMFAYIIDPAWAYWFMVGGIIGLFVLIIVHYLYGRR